VTEGEVLEDIQTRKNPTLRLKESLKSGFRVRLDISALDAESISVSISSDNILRVFHTIPAKDSADASAADEVTLHQRQLLESCLVQALVCVIVNQSLYIRERSKEVAALEYTGTLLRFLPVVAESETEMRFTVTLRVPVDFTHSDVFVKTIDDSLMIRGQCSSSIEENPPSPSSSLGSLTPGTGVHFSVMTKLPEGAVSRTVRAEMSSENQLIIRGRLNPASRRMTCAF